MVFVCTKLSFVIQGVVLGQKLLLALLLVPLVSWSSAGPAIPPGNAFRELRSHRKVLLL